jgi:hypothetical protein
MSALPESSSEVQPESTQADSSLGDTAREGPKNLSSMNESERSVSLLVKGDDRTILQAVIDRTKSQSRILKDLRKELAGFGVPYRDVDPRLFEAVRLHESDGLTYAEASIRVFGNDGMANSIRYWHNNWARK